LQELFRPLSLNQGHKVKSSQRWKVLNGFQVARCHAANSARLTLDCVKYIQINIGQLDCFESGASLSLEDFVKHGLIKDLRNGVKILSNGELTKSLTVKAHKFSSAAKDRIIAAGGSVEVL
jgi:large subunit ribosomal protein L15